MECNTFTLTISTKKPEYFICPDNKPNAHRSNSFTATARCMLLPIFTIVVCACCVCVNTAWFLAVSSARGRTMLVLQKTSMKIDPDLLEIRPKQRDHRARAAAAESHTTSKQGRKTTPSIRVTNRHTTYFIARGEQSESGVTSTRHTPPHGHARAHTHARASTNVSLLCSRSCFQAFKVTKKKTHPKAEAKSRRIDSTCASARCCFYS